ncbi:hypothetical protein JXB27_03325 [Candidatus Woesearchaeota archaeon]|nr:hypothetical protein [Candidatus Woesearchaeota archaeon]
MDKKAQGAGGAAGLIAIIALALVLYLLILPSNVRESLINGTVSDDRTSSSKSKWHSSTLILAHPKTLDPEQNTDREKILDSFTLYSDKSAVVIAKAEAMHIENGWFAEKVYNLSFKVDDLANTDNYILAFDVSKAYGRLILTLNGDEIYDSEVMPGNAEPVAINENNVKTANSLIFEVSGVGGAFWKLNEYDLSNVRVIADFTDTSKKEYKNFFMITATEKDYFEKTKLSFVPECLTPKNLGPITVTINGKDLHYSAVPDCGMLSSIEFNPNYLNEGENYITFRAETGNYLIDRVKIKADLKEIAYPFYYFELDEDDYDDVLNETANVTLELKFADKEHKEGELNVNGHLSSIDTYDSIYTKNINEFVQEDQNSLQIKPITTLNILDLTVSIDR